ncbi:cytochrome B6 [Candidatus Synechococcus calcipolaris G9]|uniref:Cytochrome b6-f complex subunit 7 n=1 Tax=Candidatus Synechococcus calcipolaris G9 TaxID=1497997 RepID=A0ABT6EYH2_9SYNE|nr:PetM family cytochrome b6-f complex subunit 7 [Candidatus Synechococcus calcipolaris]MDG2990867.1 cytochrome B6 [Candidatus Synechococcus calcipolaris G9]
MGQEIFNTSVISFTLVLVGLGLGYLLLRLTPDD